MDTQVFSQQSQGFMVSPMNRCTPPAFYFLQSSSVPITHPPSHSGPYEDLNQTATTDFFLQHSNPTSIPASSTLLHHDTSSTCSSLDSSPLISSLAVHSTSASTQDILSVSENDPFFIPVQGVLPPSKNFDGRYECQLCDRSYTHAKHLKRHMMRHTGQKPYGCIWCTSRFTRPDIRKRHVLKCKVRRKMEGLECIKIEEENPARMISLKNQKMNERKAKKLAEAKAQGKASPKPASKPAGKPKQQQSLPPTPVQPASAQITISTTTSLLQSDFDPSILEASIKKELELSTTFYNTPVMSCDDLAQQQRPQEISDQTVLFSSLPTPAFNHPIVPGYMTPTESSPQVGMQQLKPGHQELSLAQQQRMYYFDFPSNPGSQMELYYNGNATHQPHFQPQLLTPQQYRVNQSSPHHGFFNESAACMSGESPLETFVPPMYHDQQ